MDSQLRRYKSEMETKGPYGFYRYALDVKPYTMTPTQAAAFYTVAAVASDLSNAPRAAEDLRDRVARTGISADDLQFLLGPYSSILYYKYTPVRDIRDHAMYKYASSVFTRLKSIVKRC